MPWTDGALRPAALVAVLNEIVFAERRTIVELGAGISTTVIGRLLAERGGTLTTIEHDPDWSAIVSGQLEREGLAGTVKLLGAPLEPHPETWDGAPWYSLDAIASLSDSIELLLVDGPPGYREGMAHSRYPALPALAGRLAPHALVMLDDANREPEREIVERWQQLLPEWSFSVDDAVGLALGRR
ncbi:MAG: class I SAM-dependent methyltransferase [Actinomycetota bacterium]|nr:class I SAM-dependent methyltransferase [Actinomycetota bacterium]